MARTQIADALLLLLSPARQVRTRLIQEYNKKLQALAPDLRSMGKATGDQMLVRAHFIPHRLTSSSTAWETELTPTLSSPSPSLSLSLSLSLCLSPPC